MPKQHRMTAKLYHILATLVLVLELAVSIAFAITTTRVADAASVGMNDYPAAWQNATDCSLTYGVYSWCINTNGFRHLASVIATAPITWLMNSMNKWAERSTVRSSTIQLMGSRTVMHPVGSLSLLPSSARRQVTTRPLLGRLPSTLQQRTIVTLVMLLLWQALTITLVARSPRSQLLTTITLVLAIMTRTPSTVVRAIGRIPSCMWRMLGLVVHGPQLRVSTTLTTPSSTLTHSRMGNRSILGSTSCLKNGQFALIVSGDGYVALFGGLNSRKLWQTTTSGSVSGLAMQNDGNLVLYSSSGSPLWATGTGGNSGDSLVVQNDGNVVLYSWSGVALWSTGTGGSGTRADNEWTDHLNDGQGLVQYQFIQSADGRYTLLLRDNGDLLLYGPGYSTLWHASTANNAGDSLAMQNDGNLVLYGSSGSPLWSTATGGNSDDSLVVQNDGNVVLYSWSGVAMWSTGT